MEVPSDPSSLPVTETADLDLAPVDSMPQETEIEQSYKSAEEVALVEIPQVWPTI